MTNPHNLGSYPYYSTNTPIFTLPTVSFTNNSINSIISQLDLLSVEEIDLVNEALLVLEEWCETELDEETKLRLDTTMKKLAKWRDYASWQG